jgi:hypothetical protein
VHVLLKHVSELVNEARPGCREGRVHRSLWAASASRIIGGLGKDTLVGRTFLFVCQAIKQDKRTIRQAKDFLICLLRRDAIASESIARNTAITHKMDPLSTIGLIVFALPKNDPLGLNLVLNLSRIVDPLKC